jgi:hypothetical protein
MTLFKTTKTISGLLIAIALTLAALASSANAAGPVWEIGGGGVTPNPMERGVVAKTGFLAGNSGDGNAVGTVTVTHVLSPGLKMIGFEANGGNGYKCEGDGTAAVPLSCSSDVAVGPVTNVGEFNIEFIPGPDAPDTVTDTFTVSGAGAAPVTKTISMAVVDYKPFEIGSFTARTTDQADADYQTAGGHPWQNVTKFTFPVNTSGYHPSEQLKDAAVDLPLGFFGNPAAAPRCPISGIGFIEFFTKCPDGSKIGFVQVGLGPASSPLSLFNVKPDYGYPAQFTFNLSNVKTSLYATLGPRTEGYRLTVGSSDALRLGTIDGFIATFYGTPQQHSVLGPEQPFLSNPVSCSDTKPTWDLTLDSWEKPGVRIDNGTPIGIPDLSDPNWLTDSVNAPPVTGCDDPKLADQFKPTLDVKPVQGGGPTQADSPTGLSVAFKFPQSNDPTDPDNTNFDPDIPQAPEPKDVTVTLPEGVSISPSSADGLDACSDRAADPAGDQVHYDNVKPVTCPDAARIGSVTTVTPLLASHDPATDKVTGAEPLSGDVYLLKPHPGDLSSAGNQDGTFRLLMQIDSRRYGINLKLPGIAVADKQTGQLRATFTDNPQLPASELRVDLKSGPRAPLATPATCGSFTTSSDVVPWSTPGTPDAHPTSTFSVGSGPNGKACANSPGARPFSPGLSAGTESAVAGSHSPFVLKLNRNDGDQELSAVDVTLPKGLTATLAGVPYCSEAAIAAATGKSGVAERNSSSCPAASQIGSLVAGAGPGSNPYYTAGKAYLAGPYKGAPLSFAFITPAVAGPFDLGNIVVRAAAYVDPETTQVTVKTDPIPQIRDGVPLRIRSIVTRIDRSNFTLNPTSCEGKSVNASFAGGSGASANVSNPFQVGDCAKLGFAPKLSLDIKGGVKRGAYQRLKAILTAQPGEANIGKVAVTLPHSVFLAQEHIKTICTRVQYAAKACPAASVYGFARAYTPLLDQPLEGPVYLRSSSNELPDLVASLDGQIHVDLVGRIDSIKGGIRNTFEAVPDAPVSKFVLEMQGGKKSLLVNSRNICKSSSRATVEMNAQNGRVNNFRPPLTNSCKKKKHPGKKGKHSTKGAKRHGKH